LRQTDKEAKPIGDAIAAFDKRERGWVKVELMPQL
jgi:hypothetical protein